MLAPAGALHIAIVGSPNAGKTSLFNALAGVRARTANYPGVTVSRREASVRIGDRAVTLADLPVDDVGPKVLRAAGEVARALR